MKLSFPLKLRRREESFIIEDAAGIGVAFVYFREEPQTARVAKALTPDVAEEVAKVIARALTESGRG